MKKAFVLAAAFAALSSHAQGFRCRAVCAGIDARSGHVIYFGTVESEGSRKYFTPAALFEKAEARCAERAFPYAFPATLVDHLVAVRITEAQDSESSSRTHSRRYEYGSSSAKLAPVRIDAYDFAEWTAIDPYGYPETSYRSAGFSIRYWPSSADSACRTDVSISDDETPVYEGDLPILGD